MKTAPCPHCRKPAALTADNPFRPFCSERCKLVDFGGWIGGRYSIPAEEPQDEFQPDEPPHRDSRLQ